MPDWDFTPWEQIEYDSPEEGLADIAEGTTDEGLTWWQNSDRIAAFLEQFGRTKALKRSVALALGAGRSARIVEIRDEIARKFPPEHRHRDVVIELYKECRFWDDPIQALEDALGKGWSAADARRVRMGQNGQATGDLLFRRQEAMLEVLEVMDGEDTLTTYLVSWTEEGLPPFSDENREQPVFVSVRERIPANERSPEGE